MGRPLSDESLDQLFRSARSFNRYTEQPVALETLQALYDLYKWGPTSTNQQPQRIVWCTTDDAKERLAKLSYEGNADKIRLAPVTAILGMEMNFIETLPKLFPHTDARGWYGTDERFIADSALRNASLQAGYLMIAARALGLDVGPIGGFDEKSVTAEFFPASTIKANFLVTLGYGDLESVYPRAPRWEFNEATRLA